MMMATRFLIIPPGWFTPILHRPRPDFHVPHAAPKLAKIPHAAAPKKPRKGAHDGQSSYPAATSAYAIAD